MATPIYIFAGQSNADGMRKQLYAAADAHHAGMHVSKAVVAGPGAPLTRGLAAEDWINPGELRAELHSTAHALLAADPTAYIAGVIWVQGEGDTYGFTHSERYAENLWAIDNDLRSFLQASFPGRDTGADDFNWVVTGLSNHAPAKDIRLNWRAIKEEQIKATEGAANMTWVDPDRVAQEAGFSSEQMFKDPLHYSNQFATALAQSLVRAAAGEDAPPTPRKMLGSQGDDVMLSATGGDTLFGFDGDDAYHVRASDVRVSETIDGGHDVIISTVDLFLFRAGRHVEDLMLAGNEGLRAKGNSLDNTMVGNSGDNSIKGGWGHDTLIGMDGDDRMNGQSGKDVLIGGLGDDTYIVNLKKDRVIENDGEGHDLIISRTSASLAKTGQSIEDLTLLGHRDSTGVGNVLANTIIGNEGANRLFGRGGDDTLTGGEGDDWLLGGGGADVFSFALGDGADIVADFDPARDRLDFAPTIAPEAIVIEHRDEGTMITYSEADQVFLADVFL